MENTELNHSGVLGMKWGVRRYQNKDGSLTAAGRKRYGTKAGFEQAKRQDAAEAKKKATAKAEAKAAKDAKKAQVEETKPKTKRVSEMSDTELREHINRLKLENEYKSYAQSNKTSKGKEFVSRVLERIGENVITNLGTQAANKALGLAINKAFGVDPYDTTNRIVNPNKGQSDKK
jgi:alanyl-tRNA synthetase